MINWKPAEPDGTQHCDVQLSDGSYATGSAWYSAGAYCWRVFWNGYSFRDGTACLDRKEARRTAEYWLEKILRDECEPPWKASAERQALEQRLMRARTRLEDDSVGDPITPPWGWIP